MISGSWPLFGLRMTIGELTLRALTEDDLPTLADLLPADVERDPAATRYDVDADANHPIVVHQGYWKAWGTWSPMDWALTLAGIRDGALIGTQTLEGTDFVVLRTVNSASFLAAPEQGTRSWQTDASRGARAGVRSARRRGGDHLGLA